MPPGERGLGVLPDVTISRRSGKEEVLAARSSSDCSISVLAYMCRSGERSVEVVGEMEEEVEGERGGTMS